ncbi:MAG: M56 family metallopeptidase [Pseudomonadota bacterium]
MANDLLAASWIVGWLLAAILVARVFLHRLFGAQLAYIVWLAVPLALVVALLPARFASRPAIEIAAPVQRLAAQGTQLLPPAPVNWLTLAWALGCIGMLLWFWRGHARAGKSLAGPAVVGLWRPAIVVPPDFRERYTAQEQQLILAHEQVHIARRDPLFNAVCALIQCLFWFHPLVHLGARRYRLDQELACDAAVMRSHPDQRRSYADAMLKTQLSSQASLIYCHWQSIHPLKERIMKLQQTAPRAWRKLAGKLVVGGLIGFSGYGAMAAQAGEYQIDLDISAQGKVSTPRVRTQAGETFAIAVDGWHGEFVLKKVNEESMYLTTVIKHDSKIVGKPNLLVKLGEPAKVVIGGDSAADTFSLKMTVAAAK